MKNIIALFILLSIGYSSHSQGFHYPLVQQSGKTISDFIPANWDLKDSTAGDLNGDHIPDLALVIEYKDKINELRPDSSFYKAKPLILLILFGNNAGPYDLVLQNNTVISRGAEGGWDESSFEKVVISNQILSLAFDIERGSSIYKFRYQKENFYLIGANEETAGHGEATYTEVNFLTRKEKDTNADGEHIKVKWRTILPGHLIKLKDLKMIGKIEIHPGFYL